MDFASVWHLLLSLLFILHILSQDGLSAGLHSVRVAGLGYTGAPTFFWARIHCHSDHVIRSKSLRLLIFIFVLTQSTDLYLGLSLVY